jgi:hypothetical protein
MFSDRFRADFSGCGQRAVSIAGHVSPRMLAHYSHVRLEAKRKALEALSSRHGQEGYATIHVTNDTEQRQTIVQPIENIGGADGVRTRDLLRDRQAF